MLTSWERARRAGATWFAGRQGCLVMLAGLLPGAIAHANISVTPMSTTISTAAHGIGQLRVISRSKETQYIQVNIVRVDAPGTPTERQVMIAPADGAGLVASPHRIVLPAGATRVIRVATLTIPDKETVYRVFIEPVPVADADDSARTADGDAPETPRLNVVVAWGAIVFVKPKTADPRLQLIDQQRRISNIGNVTLRLERSGRCTSAKGRDDCVWQRIDRYLYPEQVYSLPVLPDAGRFTRIEYKLDDAVRSQVWGD